MTLDMNELMRALGKLEGKIDAFIQTQKEHFDRMNRIDENMEGLEERVRTVEKKQYGVFLVATVLWGLIVLVFKTVIH